MERDTAIAATIGIGVILFVIAANAGASTNPDTQDTYDPNVQMDNLTPFLAMIRHFESGDDYYKLYGGSRFADDSVFPNVRIPFRNPLSGLNDYSTAAGAYQINFPTFTQFGAGMGIYDFSPASQDQIAINILTHDGVMGQINAGSIAEAIALASRRWASLPGSTAKQNPVSLVRALDYFNSQVA